MATSIKQKQSIPRHLTSSQISQINQWLKKHHLVANRANWAKARAAILNKKRPKKKPEGRDVTIQESAAEWQIIYGHAKVGGIFSYAHFTSGNDLLLVVTLACHKVHAITSILFDDEDVFFGVTFDTSQNGGWAIAGSNPKYKDKVYAQVNLGEEDQTALSQLITDSGGDWSSNDRQRGRAHIYLRLKNDPNVFQSGLPQISFWIEGKEVPNWSAVYPGGYTTNPWLCAMDLLTDTDYGASRGFNLIQVAGSIAAEPFGSDSDRNEGALICDEAVALDGGGTETRYTCNLALSATEGIRGMLEKLLSCFGGQVVHFSSFVRWIAILAPKMRDAVGIIDIYDLLSDIDITTTDSLTDYFGRVGGTYIDQSKNHEETDFPDVSFGGVDGTTDPYNDRQDLSLPGTISPTMAQRLAKIFMMRHKYSLKASFKARLNCYKYSAGDVVSIPISDLGWDDGRLFEIQSLELVLENDDNGAPCFAVSMEVKETASAIFAWDETTEEQAVAAMPDVTVPTPPPLGPGVSMGILGLTYS